MTYAQKNPIPSICESWVRAKPGERVIGDDGFSATATDRYKYFDGELFRRFSWHRDAQGNLLMNWSWAEWMRVPCRWDAVVEKSDVA